MNNTSIRLIKADETLKQQFLDFHREMSAETIRFVPYACQLQGRSYLQWLRDCRELEVKAPQGFVTSSTYVLIVDDTIIGGCSIRHELNERLRFDGGHIGYGLRPSFRGQGWGTLLLKMALEVTQSMGMDEVMLTCFKSNIASARVIVQNGGVLSEEYDNDKQQRCQRYWISIKK